LDGSELGREKNVLQDEFRSEVLFFHLGLLCAILPERDHGVCSSRNDGRAI
jgi:hypothetical protein